MTVEDTVCMHYMVDRLNGIRTESDLMGVIDELQHNIRVNDDWRDANPNISDEHAAIDPDDFDVQGAIDNVKRNYIERAMTRSKNVTEAAKLLGLKNYQTLQNWMEKLGVDYD